MVEPYFPAAHAVQVVEPDVEKVPAGQLAHTVESDLSEDVAPGSAIFPAGHETSPVQPLDVSPVVEPYFPAGHLAQTVSSVTTLDLAPATAYVPIGHDATLPEQESVVSFAMEPNFPAGHEVQVVEPDVEKVPAGQLSQTFSSVTEFDLAPGIAFVPAGQVTAPEHLEEVCPDLSP